MRDRWFAGIAGLALCLAAAGCGHKAASVTRSGHVVERHVSVASFSGLKVSGAFIVRVTAGDAEAVTVRVDQNLVDRLDVGVSGGTLHVGLKPGTSVSNATMEAEVAVRRLENVEANGASQVQLENELHADTVAVRLSGASRAELKGSAKRLDVEASGASSFDANGLEIDSLDIRLSGAAHATVHVIRSVAAVLSGSSTLGYSGSPTFTKREVSGSAQIRQL